MEWVLTSPHHNGKIVTEFYWLQVWAAHKLFTSHISFDINLAKKGWCYRRRYWWVYYKFACATTANLRTRNILIPKFKLKNWVQSSPPFPILKRKQKNLGNWARVIISTIPILLKQKLRLINSRSNTKCYTT